MHTGGPGDGLSAAALRPTGSIHRAWGVLQVLPRFVYVSCTMVSYFKHLVDYVVAIATSTARRLNLACPPLPPVATVSLYYSLPKKVRIVFYKIASDRLLVQNQLTADIWICTYFLKGYSLICQQFSLVTSSSLKKEARLCVFIT